MEAQLPPLRLDHYLKLRLPRYSRQELQGYVRDGAVVRLMHTGELLTLKAASRVHPGYVIRLRRPPPPPADPASAPKQELTILYEDEALLVVDKPAGMLVHPAGVRLDGTVIGLLREQYGNFQLDLAHRLDRETSGLLLLTRHPEASRRMKTAFKRRQVHKKYQAVVRGKPAWLERVVDLPLGEDGGAVRVRQAVREDGAPASTRFRFLKRLGSDHALLEAEPETGRLHQIRVHLEAIGLPLVGDKIYGGDGSSFLEFRDNGLTPALLDRLGHWRHALHAAEIAFEHPVNGRSMAFFAPLPADLVELMGQLETGGEPT